MNVEGAVQTVQRLPNDKRGKVLEEWVRSDVTLSDTLLAKSSSENLEEMQKTLLTSDHQQRNNVNNLT